MKPYKTITIVAMAVVCLLAASAAQAGIPDASGGCTAGCDKNFQRMRLIDSDPAPLLQFRSGEHILGFAPDRVYAGGAGHALIEEFVGARPVQPQPAAVQAAGCTGAPPLQAVTYSQLWDGITVSYTTSAAGLAMSTYRVEPQADPNRIRLRYNTDVALQPDGSLQVQHPAAKGYFTLSAPKAWQELGGRRVPVSVAFTRPEERVVGFAVGAYDATQPLLIDPTYAWHTFQGSSDNDNGYAIAVDDDGNVYVTGASDTGWGAPLHPHSGEGATDLVVMKFDRTGALQWHTFYGSPGGLGSATGVDAGYGIAVGAGGEVYVTGSSHGAWNGPRDQAPLSTFRGYQDIVVLKLDSAGTYQWHTFFGSGYWDSGNAIALDADGAIYVTGVSWDPWGARPIHSHGGNGWDTVVLKLDSDGTLRWNTFAGAKGWNYGYGIAVDDDGNVYVTGKSDATWGTPLNPHNGVSGLSDLFVLKLNSAGAYQWHTFYGGSAANDAGQGVAVDGGGNVYVAGWSSGPWGTPLDPYGGGDDIVVMKLDSEGTLLWHSFYGAAAGDAGYGIAVDGAGRIYVTGGSWGAWGTPLHPYAGYGWDIVTIGLDSDGVYQWHTFYGATASIGSDPGDVGRGIAWDGDGYLYVTGYSTATWGTPLQSHSGNRDIVVLKLAGDPGPNPDPFTFADLTGVPLSAQQVSNSITVAGIAAPAAISVSGDASSAYAINGGAWTSAPGSARDGDTVQVRHTSAATYGASVATTLTIGGVSDTFTSTTTDTVVGGLTIVGTTATVIDMGGLTIVTGSVDISDNPDMTEIDVSSLITVGGSIDLSGNTSLTTVDASSLTTVVGSITLVGDTALTEFDASSLTTVGGSVTVTDNTALTTIDASSLTTVSGSVDVSDNAALTTIDVSSLTTVVGSIDINGNTTLTTIDASSLTTVGGTIDVSDNSGVTTIDASGLATVSGDVIIVDNGNAAVDVSSGANVSGSVIIETTGTGSFPMGDGTVTGDISLDAAGYTEISGTTPGGALDLTATHPEAVMHLQVQAATFSTPVSFTVTRVDPVGLVPESGLDVGGAPATIDPIAAYQFNFAVPTLNRDAALSFDIDLAQLDVATQTALLGALAAGTATLVTKGDAVGSVFQAFPICASAETPTAGGCVRVETFDALGLPTSGTPAIVRFSNVVGHFSTWAVAIVNQATQANRTVICSTLGSPGLLDIDFFEFNGIKGEKVTVALAPNPAGTFTPGRAALSLFGIGLLKLDATVLPNTITATLPRTGTFYVTVSEPLLGEGRFSGAYCASLESSGNAWQSFRGR